MSQIMIFHTKIYEIMEKSFLYFKTVDGNVRSYFAFNILKLYTSVITKNDENGKYFSFFTHVFREHDFEKIEKITEVEYNYFICTEVEVDLPF